MSNAGCDALVAISLTPCRGRAARAIADLADLKGNDRLADIGCGPGTAVRVAAKRGAAATGIDPSPVMLRFARWISALRRAQGVTWADGRAEALPLPAQSVTVVWSLSSVHHWSDRRAGLAEISRVLSPGGRVLLAERLIKPGARGHAAHGLSRDQAAELAAEMAAAGLSSVATSIHRAGRRTLIVVQGVT